MRFLFASDSFKGTLTSERINELLTEAAVKIFPDCETLGVPVADGGEGTADAVIGATGGIEKKLAVTGPLWERTQAGYGIIGGDTAVIEMAAASGLPLVPENQRNPLKTTTFGTGELILDAVNQGFRKIVMAIGGSATNDGGMGAMRALGIRFLDREGRELAGAGEDLGLVEKIDLDGLYPGVKETQFQVMCDVKNPLTGPEGATYTYGKQKGGSKETLDLLESGMLHYEQVLLEQLGKSVKEIPGAGAAGGLGAALCVFLNAEMKSGIETVLDLIHFDELLEQTDLVVTGEGCMDWQSAYGKVPGGVGERCRLHGVPAVAIVGSMGEGAERIYEHGICSILTTVNRPMDLQTAMEQAEELYLNAAERMFRMLKV